MDHQDKRKNNKTLSGERMRQAEEVLQHRFHYESFRNGQKEIISCLLDGHDVFAMLPTGGGKSLCYEIPGYIFSGLVLIVSPLLSLMEDQMNALRMIGESRVCTLNSMVHPLERKRILDRLNGLRFLYLSPEMLRQHNVIDALKHVSVSLFVIDEAHCVSQWGHEFRPDYLHLAEAREKLGHPICLALTATADHKVKEDICHYLHLENARKIMMGVDRPNIAMIVVETKNNENKAKELLGLINTVALPGIVYCSGRRLTEQLANLIGAKLKLRTAFYHGGMDQEDRRKIQNQFLANHLDVLCCTSAFGMGINKPDIRLVVHYQYPCNLNAYLQEIGRAARDGGQGLAILFHAPEDDLLPVSMIENNYPSDSLISYILDEIGKGRMNPLKQPSRFMNEVMQTGASETAARFLMDQLKSIPEGTPISSALPVIDQAIQARRKTQYEDLAHMRAWIRSDSCRRAACLKFFDEKLVKKPDKCCDHCGTNISDFTDERHELKDSPSEFNWKKRLAALLRTD